MPSKNPRLSVVLTPAVAATLSAIADETGESASSLVRGLLEQAAPALNRMLQLVRAAKSAKGQIGDGVRGSMDRVVDDLEDAITMADVRMGRVVEDIVGQAETVKGRRRRGVGGADGTASAPPSTPVPVTRGLGPPREGERKGKGGGVQRPKVAAKRVSRGSV